jgi:hypothetical protein
MILTAAAAMLAFISLTHSTFWGSLAYVLVGGVGVGTLLTLLFLPALYAIWFRVPHASLATPTDQVGAERSHRAWRSFIYGARI